MGSNIFAKRGFTTVREEKKRQDEAREKAGSSLWRLFLKSDGDEAQIRFLTEEPINFYEHTVQNSHGGKTHYDNIICTGDDCELCEGGDRPSFKGAFLIWDMRPYEYEDKKTHKKETREGQLRLYVAGTKVLSQLDRLSERYGLTSRDYTLVRTGSGTSTTYTLERGDDVRKLSTKEIESMLPENLRKKYDGTMESLYDILQDQLSGSADSSPKSTKNDDEGEEEEDTRRSRTLVGVDDDDEEEKPAKKTLGKKALFKSKKPMENSVKKLFKKK